MANLILPSRRIVAPQQGVALNRAKVKETGTLFAAFAGTEFRDVVSGLRLANPGGSRAAERGRVATFNGSQSTNLPFTMPSGYTGLVVAARIRATGTQPGDPGTAFGIFTSNTDQGGFGVGFNSAGNQVGTIALTTNGTGVTSSSPATIGQWYTVYGEVTGNGNGFAACYVDGKPAQSQANYSGGMDGTPNEIVVGSQHRASGFLRWFNGEIAWAAVLQVPGAVALTTTGLTPELAARLYASNYPYNLLAPIDRRILVAVPSGATSHSLDASAQAAAAASAALSVAAGGVSVSLDAAGAAQAAASAALAKVVTMSAQGPGQAAGAAVLWKGVSLAAAGLAVSSAAGNVSHAVPLTATAAAVAQSGANLALAVTLSASALAQAEAAAGLATTKSLGAAGAAQASATVDLYTSGSNSLGAAGAARASGSAVLSLVVGLTSAGAASSVGGGSLWLDVPLGAAAFAQAQADGGLTLWVPLAADALSNSQGSAVLAGDIYLSAGGQGLAVGRAELQIGTPGLAVTSGYSATSCGRSWAAKRRPRRFVARTGGAM